MQTYIDFVEKLASEGQDEIFFNSGPTHASIVMSRIFKYAKDSVRIFCGGFNGAVSNDDEYLKYLDDFLQKGGKLKVLVEEDLSKGQGKIFRVLRNHKANVEVYQTSSRVTMNNGTGQPQRIHFTVGDDKMLRIETGVEDYRAQVNFGNTGEARVFIDLFEKLLPKGKAISLA